MVPCLWGCTISLRISGISQSLSLVFPFTSQDVRNTPNQGKVTLIILSPFFRPVSPLPMPQAPSDAWNLNEAAPLQFLDYFLGTYLGTSGRFNVNTLTDFLAPGGVLNLTTLSTVNHTISLGNHTTLMAKIGPVIISGLDTVSTFDVLKVAGAQLLNTTVALKRLSFNGKNHNFNRMRYCSIYTPCTFSNFQSRAIVY